MRMVKYDKVYILEAQANENILARILHASNQFYKLVFEKKYRCVIPHDNAAKFVFILGNAMDGKK